MKFLLALLVLPALSSAATVQLTDPTGGLIPDGSISGLSRTLELNRPGEAIVSVSVDLTVSAASGLTFLGDLYIYLTTGDHLVTLLNRPGRDTGSPDGYNDRLGLNITLSDTAATDIHSYRSAVTGDETLSLLITLAGTFQPDGRTTSPLDVLAGDPRTSQLSDFNGLAAEQSFTLFAADLSTGASHQIDAWALNIETEVIPEPSSTLLAGLFGFGSLMTRRRSLMVR